MGSTVRVRLMKRWQYTSFWQWRSDFVHARCCSTQKQITIIEVDSTLSCIWFADDQHFAQDQHQPPKRTLEHAVTDTSINNKPYGDANMILQRKDDSSDLLQVCWFNARSYQITIIQVHATLTCMCVVYCTLTCTLCCVWPAFWAESAPGS